MMPQSIRCFSASFMRRDAFAVLAFLFSISTVSPSAQSANDQIRGRIADRNGAAVSGARSPPAASTTCSSPI